MLFLRCLQNIKASDLVPEPQAVSFLEEIHGLGRKWQTFRRY